MNRHLQTFSRHRIALLIPIVVALVASGYYTTTVPHKYESVMTLWFDNAAPQQSSLTESISSQTPADAGQAVLTEFLGTGSFLFNVADTGPLTKDLEGSTYRPSRNGTLPPAAIQTEIISDLGKAFTVTTTGPQVVKVTMTSQYPQIMEGTLNAVASDYVAAVEQNLSQRDSATQTYYKSQVIAAQQALALDNAAVNAYQDAHPGASLTNDPKFNQLTEAALQAQTNYTTLEASLEQSDGAAESVASPAAFHIIDAASAPIKVSSKKHEIFTVVAGLGAGIIISLIALSALTSLDKTARRQEDLDGLLGMEVVATIQQLPVSRKMPLTKGIQS